MAQGHPSIWQSRVWLRLYGNMIQEQVTGSSTHFLTNVPCVSVSAAFEVLGTQGTRALPSCSFHSGAGRQTERQTDTCLYLLYLHGSHVCVGT